jgi:hypothetical protein
MTADAPSSGPPAGPLSPGSPVPPRRNRRLLFILLAVFAALIVLGVAGTIVTLTLNNAGGKGFAVNSCVKQDGANARETSCSDPNAFVIVRKVDKQENCPDPNQPFVVLERSGGKDEVLCLRPASQK